MSLTVKTGKISHLTSGTWGVGRNGNYNQLNTWDFRIDGVPVKMKSGSQNSLSDGDLVTVIGKMKKGSFMLCAIRNETTGAYDASGYLLKGALGAMLIMVGIPLSLFIVGIAPLFFGCMMVYDAYIGYTAKSMLDATPRQTIDTV